MSCNCNKKEKKEIKNKKINLLDSLVESYKKTYPKFSISKKNIKGLWFLNQTRNPNKYDSGKDKKNVYFKIWYKFSPVYYDYTYWTSIWIYNIESKEWKVYDNGLPSNSDGPNFSDLTEKQISYLIQIIPNNKLIDNYVKPPPPKI
jgi:hypothetical protein